MRKYALILTVTTAVLGIFGAFLRWLQNLNGFDELGLALRGAGTMLVFTVYSLLSAGLLLAVVLVWLRRYVRSADASVALRAATVLPMVLGWVLAAVTVAVCAMYMFSADSGAHPRLQRVFSAAGILFGFCLPFMCAGKSGGNPNGKAVSAYASAFCCFWLVFSYRQNAENPVIWSFAPEIIAVCCAAVAYYYICSYYYGRAKTGRAVYAVMLSAYTSIATIFDERSTCVQALFAVNTAVMLMLEYVLIENMSEDPEKD